ncbi:uncharacterized protein METZ01_LOCUS274393, partial [marine metagenome]
WRPGDGAEPLRRAPGPAGLLAGQDRSLRRLRRVTLL